MYVRSSRPCQIKITLCRDAIPVNTDNWLSETSPVAGRRKAEKVTANIRMTTVQLRSIWLSRISFANSLSSSLSPNRMLWKWPLPPKFNGKIHLNRRCVVEQVVVVLSVLWGVGDSNNNNNTVQQLNFANHFVTGVFCQTITPVTHSLPY